MHRYPIFQRVPPARDEHHRSHVVPFQPDPVEKAKHVTDGVRPALAALAEKLGTCAWDKPSIGAAIKEVLTVTGLKMPQLAMPVRVLVLGTPQTPSLDAVLALCDRQTAIERLGQI